MMEWEKSEERWFRKNIIADSLFGCAWRFMHLRTPATRELERG